MKLKILIIILLSNVLFADFRIDSLKKELSHSFDEKRIDILLQLSEQLARQNPDSAKKYAQLGLKLAEQFDDTLNQANFLYNLSVIYHLMVQKDADFEYARKALDMFKALSLSSKVAKCYAVMGCYYHNYSDFKNSFENFQISLKIYKKENNQEGMIYCINSISSLYDVFGGYNKALEFSLKALEMCDEIKNSQSALRYTLEQNGEIYYKLKDYKNALRYYKLALNGYEQISGILGIAITSNSISKIYFEISNTNLAEIFARRALRNYQKLNFRIGIAQTMINLGDIYKEDKQIHESHNFYQKSLSISKSLDHFWLQSEVLNKIGQLYLDQNQHSMAYRDLQKSYALAVKIRAKELILENYLSLSKYFEKLNIYDKSLHYYRKYAELRDSLFIKSQNEIADLQITYYNEKNQREKKLLQKNNDILKLEADKQKLQKSRFILALIIVLIVTAFILYRFYHKQQINRVLKKKVNDALEIQREQQQIILHQASLTALGELAAGIAHEVNQPLQNISFGVEIIEQENKQNNKRNETITENVQEIYGYIDRIRQTVEHIRFFTSQQGEDITQKFCINTSIKNSYRMVKKQYHKQGIKLKLSLAESLPLVDGNPYKYEQVVLNLLSNAHDAVIEQAGLSHNGYKKEILVKSYTLNGEVCMEIKDNGIGISEDNRRQVFLPFFSSKTFGNGQGLGLSIALRIVKEMGGGICFESMQLKGTTMYVKIPIREEFEYTSTSIKSDELMIGKRV